MTITIIGTGYVGLVTGAVFADFGHTVYCVDINKQKIELLLSGGIPFYEPGLAEIVKRNKDQGRLFFTTSYSEAVSKSKAVFICVGTPPAENGEANLSFLYSSIEETAKHLKNYTLIVIKSTVPIGVENSLTEILNKSAKGDFELASCPEFLREGSAVKDAMQPDRIVIGTQSQRAIKLLLEIYQPFNGQRLVCDLRSAQMIKYASNCLLATKISYANAIANLCEETHADVLKVLEGVGMDPRIGKSFLSPGVGFGGSCFPKDLTAFIQVAKQFNYDLKILEEVNEINQQQPVRFVNKIEKVLGNLNGQTLAILGLAFKPNTDDVREAPSLKIIELLLKRGSRVKAYDPIAANTAREVLGDSVVYSPSAYEAVKDAQALLVVTEWNEFKELDLVKVKKLMKQAIIFDGRNIYDPKKVKALGFTYHGVGRE